MVWSTIDRQDISVVQRRERCHAHGRATGGELCGAKSHAMYRHEHANLRRRGQYCG